MPDTAPQQPDAAASNGPPMSLAEARATRWQVAPYAPMGELLDQGRIARKDLEWAIDKAFRLDVKRAAQRLLQELDQPTPPVASLAPAPPTAEQPRPSARVVIAGRYLEDQESLHGWLLVYGIGVGITSLVTVVPALVWLARGQALWLPMLSLLATVALWVGLLWLFRNRRRARRAYQAGRKGEEQVAEQLRQALDHRWTIYRSLQLPDRRDDLDLVLVGPGGVWAVQVKATHAPLRVQGGRWEVRRGQRWVAAQPDPGRQVTGQATSLHDFLARNGVERFVERAIALAEGLPEKNFAGSPIPVWLPFNIAGRAAALVTRHPPSAGELARVNELLGRRAVEQRAGEAVGKRRNR